VSHLKLVKEKLPKPTKGARRRHEGSVFTDDEQRRARQALRNLHDAFGTWSCLADAMGMPKESLMNAARGVYALSAAIVLRAMRASGLTLEEFLGGPIPADRCRACGQIKRRAA
jgi:hypothetical protein